MRSIFTQIIESKIQAYKIFENNLIIVILAKDQIQPGHCLIIPKIEIEHFSLLPQFYLYEIHSFSQKLSLAVKNVTSCVRVGGLFAGWDVAHVHYHLIPMHKYDDLDPVKAKILPAPEMLELQAKITSELFKILNDEQAKLHESEQIKLLSDYLVKKGRELNKSLESQIPEFTSDSNIASEFIPKKFFP